MIKKIILGVLVFLVVIVVVFILLPGDRKREIGDKIADSISKFTTPSDPFIEQFGSGCQNKEVSFTHTPLALKDIGYILPMGNMGDAHVTPTDHGYIYPKNQNAAPGTYTVISPADGEIVRVEAMPSYHVGDNKNNWNRPPEDNRMILRFSCRYYMIFIHVNELAPKIRTAVGKIKPGEFSRKVVPIKAGEAIAYLGGNGVDWSLNDTQYTVPDFIHPELYKTEPWKVHTADMFSVYPQNIRKQLEDLSPRSANPAAGKIDYDVPGAAIGNWFREGTGGFSEKGGTRFWDGHLAIAPDSIDGRTIVISMGNWKGEAAQFRTRGSFDPVSVTKASGAVKVELLPIENQYVQANGVVWTRESRPIKPLTMRPSQSAVVGTVMLQVLPGEKLRFERFPGRTAAQVSGFTSAAQIFER